jgi:hypothetical protein
LRIARLIPNALVVARSYIEVAIEPTRSVDHGAEPRAQPGFVVVAGAEAVGIGAVDQTIAVVVFAIAAIEHLAAALHLDAAGVPAHRDLSRRCAEAADLEPAGADTAIAAAASGPAAAGHELIVETDLHGLATGAEQREDAQRCEPVPARAAP